MSGCSLFGHFAFGLESAVAITENEAQTVSNWNTRKKEKAIKKAKDKEGSEIAKGRIAELKSTRFL